MTEKKVRRLLRLMGLNAIYSRPKLSLGNTEHKIYPYLLNNVDVKTSNHVWSADITYIRLSRGFIYLVAIIDWFSRYILSWEVSTTLEASFCVEALEKAVPLAKPEIFNTDQGAQFTAKCFVNILLNQGIKISMDGKGRVFDNIFVERFWRSVKYEEVYLHNYNSVIEAIEGLRRYFNFYNNERLHQSLGYCTPREIYFQ